MTHDDIVFICLIITTVLNIFTYIKSVVEKPCIISIQVNLFFIVDRTTIG